MQNLKEDLKRKTTGLINKKDVLSIVQILTYELGLEDYVKNISFSEEEFRGISLENSIDYDPSSCELVINMPVLHAKFKPFTYDEKENIRIIQFNWMLFFYEIFYAFEDVKHYKYQDKNINNHETRIIKACHEFNGQEIFNSFDFIKHIKNDKVTKKDLLSDPVERIKVMNAYFETLRVFINIETDPKLIDLFKNLFSDKILKGYSQSDQGKYPIYNYFLQNTYIEGLYFLKRYFPWYDNEPMVALSNATRDVNDLKQRLAYGYPIDYTEYISVRKRKI